MITVKIAKVNKESSGNISIDVDCIAPLYYWMRFGIYNINYKDIIHDKEFTIDDFSCEHIFNEELDFSQRCRYKDLLSTDEEFAKFYLNQDLYLGDLQFKDNLMHLIEILNNARYMYLTTKDEIYLRQIIYLLPISYKYKKTVTFTYDDLNDFNKRSYNDFRTLIRRVDKIERRLDLDDRQ